jgi:hypothetical protein
VSDDTWCVVEHNNAVFRAKIVHVGKGRFRIVGDNQGGQYVGVIVDASDIFNCE